MVVDGTTIDMTAKYPTGSREWKLQIEQEERLEAEAQVKLKRYTRAAAARHCSARRPFDSSAERAWRRPTIGLSHCWAACRICKRLGKRHRRRARRQ